MEEEPEMIDSSAPDLQIDPTDPKIDVGAKSALKRMLKDPAMAVDAARLILGLKGETLARTPGKPVAGIFGDDLGVAVKVAQAHGTQRWLLVPKGEDAGLVLDATTPLDAPPTVIFRGDTPDIRGTPARIDPALQRVSRTFGLFQRGELGLCATSPSAIPVPNLVPSSFCHLPVSDLLVVVTGERIEPGHPELPVSGALVRADGPSPTTTSKTQPTDSLGKAAFSDLAPGSYQVTASKEGFKDTSVQIVLLHNEKQIAAFANGGKSPTGLKTVPLQLRAIVTQLILIEHPDQKLSKTPELTDAARWGVLRKGGIPGGSTTPLPDIPAWQDASVQVNRPKQTPLLFPVGPDSGGNPRNGEATIHGAAGKEVAIISNGVHQAPIVWHATSDQPIGTIDGMQEARLTGRVRFSLWADPNHITENNISRGADKADDIIDDMSLLITVQNDTKQKIDWDVGLKPSPTITENQLITFYRKVIDRCHAHKVQILAGFALVDRGPDRIERFDAWLADLITHADGGKAEATSFADAVVNFLDDKLPGFDGISFDIESCGIFPNSPLREVHLNPTTNKDKIDKLRRALRFFYHAIADRLVVDNRICAITVGGMMSDDAAVLPLPSVPNVKPNAMLAARLHTYDLPIGKRNIVIRPMGYDNAGGVGDKAKIKAFNSDPGQLEWHNAVVESALKTKRLNPQQLQLGIKDFQPKDEHDNPTGQGGTVPDPLRILHRCTQILRPNRVGLILFAMFKPPSDKSLGEPWNNNAKYNKALNADPSGKPIPRPLKGQPLHVPLDDTRLTKIDKKP